MADAAYYRIGWVNMETFQAVQAEDRREWLDVFAFHDVVNRGQTAQTLSDLEPGVQYDFIAASVGHRFGNAAGWSNWTYLTTADLDFDTDGSGDPGAGDAHWNEGAGWLPVGDPETRFRYNAVFDGNGHTNANLFIRWAEADHSGLFRATGEDAGIRNRRLTEIRVSGKGWVGGLVGSNGGSVSGNSGIGGLAGYSRGNVSSGGGSVSGLVGSNQGTIADSYDSGAVTGEGSYVGGLVGSSRSDSAIAGSYATGRVTGNSDVGGLIGNRHFIFVTDSYWDTQTTGQSRGDGGASKTTRELQAPTGSTGIYAGWNADWWDFGTSRQYSALKYQAWMLRATAVARAFWHPSQPG